MIQAIHSTKGRARYKVDELYRSESLKSYLERSLSNKPEISFVSANPLTSNILVHFKEENNQMDPDGPPLGKEKIFRGGSFETYAGDEFRPSLRNKTKPTGKNKSLGFRLVMDI